ncbi:hypothetical protein [uncultured Stenotrophomonas sp.]|uniref:FDXHR family putative zinc-binding protein n=1 Tax=uncultured Stenotrophomonas sp. TaxID=165438 RepID=UPI0025E42415|nr:hypothetical protein [uncultured Stenotrophomonas sp.]
MPTHPKCGKTFPRNNTHGHCSGCCETFSGLVAFDAHRVGEGHERRCEIQPYETPTDNGRTRYGHWRDNNGYLHYGKKLTRAEKEHLWGNAAA